jgi:ankyrin repeat protein
LSFSVVTDRIGQLNRSPQMQQKSGTPASALWSAAHSGDREGVRRLIAEGVDVNTWDRYGRSALIFAIEAGHGEIARELVSAGAWVDPHEDYDVYDSPLI